MLQPSEPWERVKEIFAAAMDLAPEERAVLLKKECGDDDSLRLEIESLLESDAQSTSFIEQPAGQLPRDLFPEAGEDLLTDRQFGAYQVIREIGRGGLGTVYLAARSDAEYRKEVAIKLVRRGLDTEDILNRFRTERQILAQLDHPNIARLIDGGTSDNGLPYFVMEYVNGSPIGAYCGAHALSLTERLNLFRKVCSAVAYAHQNLVIHRDLKPSNILVSADGEPKLLDFGIAKLLTPGDELFTQTAPALRAMTPEYASPEQVKGERIATTSDVYSLGVLLYELLTGRRPYRLKTSTPDEIVRAITEQEPERPSTAVAPGDGNPTSQAPNPKLLHSDLDNIVLMALRKEPARRYASVGQFSEDIRRYLEGRPVLAHKDTVAYRARKFIKRNKIAVAAAAIVLLSLVGGIIATLWQARRAEANQARAEKRFADVRGLSNALLNEIAPQIERLEGSTAARQSLVAQSLKYLDSLVLESGDDATLQGELAAAYEKVGALQGDSNKPSLSDFRGAIASMEKAETIRRRLLSRNPGDMENRRLLADNLRLLGIRRMTQNDIEGGIRDGKEAVRIYESLVAENPGAGTLRTGLLETRVEVAIAYAGINRFTEAIPMFEQAANELQQLRREGRHNPEVERLLSNCLTHLGFALSWESRQPEAEAKMDEAISLAESLAARHPHDANIKQELWRTYQTAAVIYEEINNARMLDLADKARKIAEETVLVDRVNAQARHNLARTYLRLGTALSLLERADEALAYLEKAEATYRELMEKDPLNRGYDTDAAAIYTKIANAHWLRRDYSAAFAAFEKAVALFAKKIADDPADMRALRNLATTHATAAGLHAELVETTDEQTRQTHLEAAKENFRLALDLMRKAQDQHILSEWDVKNIDAMRASLEKLEKMPPL